MELAERIERYKAIEARRGRPLIVYATSTRAGLNVSMAGDVVRELIDQVKAITGDDAVDVLIHSSGGDALAAWKLMSVLRERFKTVGVLVPFAAFSAATIFALGADEIVMHPFASLGPIDPQITVALPNGTSRQFAYEDVGAFLKFLEEDVGLSEQQHFVPVVDKLFATVDPIHVGGARRASDLSAEVGARLLSLHLKDDRRAKQIALNLNKSFFAHGDAVSRTRAKQLELKVADSDPELEKLLWEAYLGLAPVGIPPNTPPPVLQQIWQAVGQQAIQQSQANAAEVPYSLVVAVLESARLSRECRKVGTACGFRFRQPDGRIQVTMTDSPDTGWTTLPLPA